MVKMGNSYQKEALYTGCPLAVGSTNRMTVSPGACQDGELDDMSQTSPFTVSQRGCNLDAGSG